MQSREGFKWRKKALKPIETKRSGKSSDDEEELEPLSPSSRLYHEPTFNMYVIAIMGCKTKIYPNVVKANLGHTLLKHPRFSSLQVVDEKNKEEMRWVPTEVDLEKHVIIPELDPNMESPDKFLEDYIYNLSKTYIDKSQPLWDLHLINLKTSQSEAVGIFRIHHSFGDGASLLSLLLACTRQTSDPQALPTVPMKKKKIIKQDDIQKMNNNDRIRSSLTSFIWRIMIMFWSVFQMFCNTVVDVFMFVATALFLEDTKNPLKGAPGSGLKPRRVVFRTVSLDDVKLIKNAMNTTINDVAFGITQAGLSRYINRTCGVSKKIRLRSTLLVNIRPAPGILALANMMEKDAEVKWGNWIGYVLLPFTIAMRDDPLDYVRNAKAIIDRKKRSLEAFCTFYIVDLALKLFGIKVASALSCRVVSRTTMCFSNLVGPLEEIGFYGHPMAFLAPTSYGQPYALMINIQTYMNKMSIILSVDEETIPNPHQLCDDIVESLQLIKNEVLTRGLA